MSQSLLQGKRFFCREWAFAKIAHCLDSRPSSKCGGALVVGGPGCGKTALCCELVWPTALHGRQLALSKRVLAHHYCQAHDVDTLSLANFILGLVNQISRCDLVGGYAERVADPEVQEALSPEQLDLDPDDAFKKAILFPLLESDAPKQACFILVDSIDESFMGLGSTEREPGASRTVAELLANHHHLFPRWLLLVCSARKQSKSVTRLFTGFRKISLDDLRKSHVVRDIQQYILCRLDQEPSLRQHLSRETAEMLNQLHIKSNGCFLYLEKVLDGVADNFIMLREIREIPGTLNGLYLWLCQRLFVRKQFSRVQPVLNVVLAARKPLTEEQIYQCVWTRNTRLTREEFSKRFAALAKLLADGRDKSKILFHHSFAEWLLDVKHCTQKYLCQASEGHAMLALRYSLCARTLQPGQVMDFALHLSKMPLCPPLLASHLPLWLVLTRAPLEDVLSRCPAPRDRRLVSLLVEAGAHLPPSQDSDKNNSIIPKVPADPLEDLLASGGDVDQVDSHQRTLLHGAAYEGQLELCQRLISNGASLERTDKNGQTPLNLASRQGHAKVVEVLLTGGSDPDHADNDGWTPLRSSAWAGHTEVVNALLENRAEVDLADADHRTALRAAAWGGHDEIVSRLLEHGAQVNKEDKEGRTALIAAAYMGHTEIVEHLLEHGAEINHQDGDGRTALSVAALCVPASEGHAGVVSLLLECGAEVDHRDKDGMTPLLVAAFEGHSEVCELLLEGDADVDHTDDNGRTPLFAAASMGHPQVVNLLLFWGAAIDTIDSEGRTVLSIAAAQGNAEVVRQLLDRGLDEMHRDNAGWTPLHYAAFEGHLQVCELLVEAGARTSEVDNDGRIPLILASQEGHHQVAAKLLQYNRSLVDLRAHDGKTALRVATMEGHKETVHLLLSEGADMNYKDADGRSTLYLLALENRLDMGEFLLTRGSEVDARDLEGRTPLHVSAWQGHADMVDLLLLHGADVNAADNDQRTALQSAAWQGHATIVRLLLERRARVDHTCNQGATALCIAAQEGHEAVVATLLEYGADPSHADQFGRNPLRVATKGGHNAVVRLLEEFAEQGGGRGPGGSTSTTSLASASTAETKPCSAILCGQPGTESPREEVDKRRSFVSNHSSSRSSSNLTSSTKSFPTAGGTPATALVATADCRYTVSSLPPSSPAPPPGMTFTQQLQQCTRNRNRTSRILSPLGEPHSPLVSPPQSPNSEVFSPVQQILPEDRKYPVDIPRPPEPRFRRNGIVTNPNYKPGGVVGVKTTSTRDDHHQIKNKHNVVLYEESIKSTGITIKKETPL